MSDLPYSQDFSTLEAEELSKPGSEFTGTRCVCRNCGEAPPFSGADECLQCFVAITLDEDPGYLEFAQITFADQTEWLAQLEAEWARQASAGQMEAA